jgi:hypothetical protein
MVVPEGCSIVILPSKYVKQNDAIRLFLDLHQFVTKKIGTDRDTKDDVETR